MAQSIASPEEALWCVVKTKPGQEVRAEQNLLRQSYSVFHPKRTTTRRSRTGWTQRLVTLFPGYVFVCVDREGVNWAPINSTYGVQGLITIGGQPAALPQDFVEELRSRCAGRSRTRNNPDLVEGQRVQFSKGPFTQLVGEVERAGPKDRVRLLMDMLNGQISVETKREYLLN